MKLRNIHPADELAEIRSDIRRLQERENFLRRGFLNDSLPRLGSDAVAEVKPLKRRTFLRDKLPDHILNDESFWRTEFIHQVRIAPAPGAAGRLPR